MEIGIEIHNRKYESSGLYDTFVSLSLQATERKEREKQENYHTLYRNDVKENNLTLIS